MNERTKKRLLKVMGLAERGVGGEKTNAENILQAAFIKYGITDKDIKQEEQELIVESYYAATKLENKLLVQIVVCVADRIDVMSRGDKKSNWFKLTALEHIEIRAMYDYYRPLMKKEIDLLYMAFINKHDIFAPTAVVGDSGASDIDEVNMMRIMGGLRGGSFVSTKRRLSE